MKYFLTLTLLLVAVSSTKGQPKVNTDSLLAIWNNAFEADTTRMKALNAYCQTQLKNNADTVIQLSETLWDYSSELQNDEWKVHSLKMKAEALIANHDIKEAIKILETAIPLAEKLDDVNILCEILGDIGFFSCTAIVEFEQAEAYAGQLLQLAQERQIPKWIARAYNIFAISAEKQTRTKEATDFYEQAILQIKRAKDTSSYITYINNYMYLLSKTGDFDKALEISEEVIRLVGTSPKAKDQQQLSRTIKNKGDIYRTQSNYHLALKEYFKAAKILEGKNFGSDLAGLNNSIGALYQQIGDFDNAVVYFNKAYDYYVTSKDAYAQVILLVNTGTLFKQFDKDINEVYQYYQTAYDKALSIKNDDLIAFSGSGLASIKLKQNKVKEADELLKANLPIVERTGYKEEVAEVYSLYADVKKQQGQLDEAVKLAEKSYAIANQYQIPNLQSKVAIFLFELEKERGNNEKALTYFEEYKVFQDTLNNIEKRRAFAQLEMQHDYAVKQMEDSLTFVKQKAATEKELATTRTRSYALGIGGAIFGLLSLFIFYLYRKSQKARRLSDQLLEKEKEYNHALEQEQAKVELKSLCKQMDPHFMFNSLQSISHYVDQNDRKAANKYLANFAKLMRRSMNYSQMDGIALEEEVEILSTYLDLEVLRFGKAFSYHLDIDPDLDLMSIHIPPMLIQPHVENAIWHGLRHRQPQEGGRIDLHFKGQGDYLICEILDNGVGRAKSAIYNQAHRTKHDSLGNANMKKRIALINKLNDQPITLTITDKEANVDNVGTKVVVKFPI